MKLRQKGLSQIDQAPKRHTAAVYNGKSNTSGTEKGSQGALEANIRAVAAVEDALRQQEINDMANAARTSAIQYTAGAFAAHAGHLLSPFVSDSDEGGAGMGGSSGGERTLTPEQSPPMTSILARREAVYWPDPQLAMPSTRYLDDPNMCYTYGAQPSPGMEDTNEHIPSMWETGNAALAGAGGMGPKLKGPGMGVWVDNEVESEDEMSAAASSQGHFNGKPIDTEYQQELTENGEDGNSLDEIDVMDCESEAPISEVIGPKAVAALRMCEAVRSAIGAERTQPPMTTIAAVNTAFSRQINCTGEGDGGRGTAARQGEEASRTGNSAAQDDDDSRASVDAGCVLFSSSYVDVELTHCGNSIIILSPHLLHPNLDHNARLPKTKPKENDPRIGDFTRTRGSLSPLGKNRQLAHRAAAGGHKTAAGKSSNQNRQKRDCKRTSRIERNTHEGKPPSTIHDDKPFYNA